MGRKNYARKLAWALTAAMLVTSTGMTSLASAVTGAGLLEDDDYQLVNLHMDFGEFETPVSFGEIPRATDSDADKASDSDADKASDSDADKASDSDADKASDSDADKASDSDADEEDDEEYAGEIVLLNDLSGNGLIQSDKPSKVTTLAVTDGVLEESDIWEALEAGGYNPGEKFRVYTRSWLTEENDMDSAVDFSYGGLELDKDVTDLYAVSYIMAGGDDDLAIDVLCSGMPDGIRLQAYNPTDNQAWNEEGMLKQFQGTAYTNINYNAALQLAVRAKILAEDGNEVTDVVVPETLVTVGLTEDLADELFSGRSLAVLYWNSRTKATEIIDPEIVEINYSNYVQFTLKDLPNGQKSVIAIVPVDKMIEVTLENVPNGAGAVYSEEYDEENGSRKLTYLPIGETVVVPKGTELRLQGASYYNEDTDYDLKYFLIAEDDAEPVQNDEYSYVVQADSKVVLTPVFEEYDWEEYYKEYRITLYEDEEFTGSNVASGELKLRIYNEDTGKYDKVNATDWKFWPEEELDMELEEWEQEGCGNNLFELNENGRISSKEILKPGSYRLYVTCSYNGKEYGTLNDYVWVEAGVDVWFGMYLGDFDDGTVACDYVTDSAFYKKGTPFGTIQEETFDESWDNVEVAMFGGYDFAGWYKDGKESQKLEDTTAINELGTEALAMFMKEDGTFYKVDIKTEDSEDDDNQETPVTPPDNNSSNGSGSSGGSGGGGRGHNVSTSSGGSWIRDAIGWWYNMGSGSYPMNQWMKLVWNGRSDWYYFLPTGYMATGWLQVDGLTYYLHPISDGTQGYMYTGWHEIDGKWYYFSEESDGTLGHLLMNTTTPDGYQVDEAGARIQ